MQIEDYTQDSVIERSSQLSLFLNLEGFEGPIDMLLTLGLLDSSNISIALFTV